MRIFDTGSQLDVALALAPMEPGAYRFCKQYGKAGFVCADCGAVRLFQLNGGTGYARIDGRQLLCYACCDKRQSKDMAKHVGPFYAYLHSDGMHVTTWSGGKLGRVHCLNESRTGWHRGAIVRFHVRDNLGNWWQGRGAGNGMACTLRPMKRPSYSLSWGKHV